MLQEVAITTQLDWLQLPPCTPGRSHGLPNCFDVYLKLLMPIVIDYIIPLAEYSPKRHTIPQLNARAAFWRKYDIGGPSATDEKLTPIKYSELAKIWNVPYNKEFTADKIAEACGEWPPNLRESKELNKHLVQLITQVLGPTTLTYFAGTVENGDYHWLDGAPANWLELGTITDLVHVYQSDGQFPSHVFDNEHTWCLSYLEFANCLILGCPVEIANKLNEYSEVELFHL